MAVGLLERVVSGPCEPRWICNGVNDPIPIIGDITVTGGDLPQLEVLNLISNPNGQDWAVAITGVASDFSTLTGGGTLDPNTTHVQIRFEMATARVSFNGTTPVAGFPGTGTLYHSNDFIEDLPIESFLTMQFVNNQAAPSYIQVSELYPKP
jgi:hypothetical protein